LEFDDNTLLPPLFGEHNTHLKHIEKVLSISILDRGNTLTLTGPSKAVKRAEAILQTLWGKLKKKQEVTMSDVDAELRFLNSKSSNKHNIKAKTKGQDVVIKTQKKTIAPRSPNQAKYLDFIAQNEMVFGIGPAGTGKTYLAVAMAVSMFLEGTVERLIFCRPAVEAGERIGFLPGDMKEKVDPYLRPIYDAMQDMLPHDFITKKIETGEIEITPLGFMRGRTLSNAFVVLDEAQNTTAVQMKMLLTRMGESSRMVITGDITQTDLPKHEKSGLLDAKSTLEGIDEIKFMHFETKDVIRHHLVGKIIQAYDKQS
jgi:phosphate starvation-inducible PhoH-like protein